MDINFNKLRLNYYDAAIMYTDNINTTYRGVPFRVPNFVINILLTQKGVKCYVRK